MDLIKWKKEFEEGKLKLTPEEQKFANYLLRREIDGIYGVDEGELAPGLKEYLTKVSEYEARYGNGRHSHHPPCNIFISHYLIINKYKLCIGCYVGYISSIIGIIIGFLLKYFFAFVDIFFLKFGFLFYLSQLISLHRVSEKKKVKIFQKFLIGFGSGWLIFFMFQIILFHYIFKMFIIFMLINVLLFPVKLMHTKKTQKICNNCRWHNNDKICPEAFRILPKDNKS